MFSKRQNLKLKNQKAFTLIELLVVIAIIGLISTIAVVALNDAREKSRDTKRKADIVQISKALEFYYDTYGKYPVESWCDSSRGSCSAACPCTGSDWQYTTTNYIGLALRNAGLMQSLPIDPKNDSSYFYDYEPVDCTAPCRVGGWGCCDYRLTARLESGGFFRMYNQQGNPQ